MMLAIDRFNDINFDALTSIYSETIDQMPTAGYGRFENNIPAEQCFMEDMRHFFRIPNAKLFLWVVDDTPAAALRCEPYRGGMLISYLETAPEKRNRGYAKALVASVIGYFAQNGIREIYSHVGKRNKSSLSVHKFCGFKIVSDYAKLLDGTVSQNYYSMLYESTAE